MSQWLLMRTSMPGLRGSMRTLKVLKFGLQITVALLVGLACSDRPDPPRGPSPSDFHIGATREEIRGTFGEPSREQSFSKTGEAIWGPIEEFWSQVPLNSTVELWAYRVEGGTVELYFVDESLQVQGVGFAPEGVVFETGP